VEPDDVGEVAVALAHEPAEGAGLLDAVSLQDGEPAAGFGGVEKDEQAVIGGTLQDVIRAREVRGVGGVEVGDGGAADEAEEGRDAVDRGAVGAAAGVAHAEQVDEHGVEAVAFAVGEEEIGLGGEEVADHGLG
jgi:hypothetical protein